MPEAPDDEGQAQHEEHVGKDRADECGLDDSDQAGPECEDPEEELRQVAERRLYDSGHPRSETIPEAVDTPAHDGGKDAEGQSRHDERDHTARGDVSGNGRASCREARQQQAA